MRIERAPLLILVLLTVPALLGFSSVNYTGYPSDVLSFLAEWKITLGDGSEEKGLIDYEHEDYFFNDNDGTDWVVYKTPNSGGTTANSSNTRSELRHLPEWTPETGGNLTGTLKVMQVSTTGDARVPATFSVVVGQIHSSEGHENEPLKIYYKKFPGHTKGSIFWNYEINTEGDNGERWDYSTSVWGYDWSVVGSDENTYPEEPAEGIALGEEFSYEVNVFDGVMYLTFESEGHEVKAFTKDLTTSAYSSYSDIPDQVLTVFASTGQDGTEQANAYAGELQYFKQGAYNQTNGKNPADNMVWNTGAETYGGDLTDQYDNGSFAEVWFKAATVGEGYTPVGICETGNTEESIIAYPNPTDSRIQILSSKASITSLKLLGMDGKCLLNQKYSSGKTALELDLSDLKPDMYIVVAEDEYKATTSRKISKR